ncbi:melanoma-associated antigen 1-like [Ochotona princeps]|uniref:melanoma-associated antigen 1-like n=1 Tax=Ochotona princeps TaxID=9978 RepID=UPI002714A794|nr:melanoma-associated antigen 1-like [Ochotona princeps]
MMPFGQKSVPGKLEGDSQAQEEAAGFPTLGEGEAPAAASSSCSALVAAAHEEELAAGSRSPPGSPRRASSPAASSPALTQSEESSSSQDEAGPSSWQCLQDPESLFQGALEEKMADLVALLFLKYRRQEPISVEEMLSCVTVYYEDHFPEIFCKAFDCIHLIFGIEMKQADTTDNAYVLVPALGLTCHDVRGGDQSVPKTGLLITVLGLVIIGGGHVPELHLWEALSMMGLLIGRNNCIFGEPRNLLTKDWVQDGYLEYRQVPHSEPARYEFLWGPRAHAETSEMRVLQYLARFNRNDPRFCPSVNEGGVRDEEVGAEAADAGRATWSEGAG